jgi:dCMP deaminase
MYTNDTSISLNPPISKWDEKYIDLARYFSTWSKDPNTKVGAVIIGKQGQILSQGYNGFPRGVEDTKERLEEREVKLKYVVHAEQNCIYNASLHGASLSGSTLYVHGLPVCNECAKGVVQVGIKRVVMKFPAEISTSWDESFFYSSSMFKEAGVVFNRFIY